MLVALDDYLPNTIFDLRYSSDNNVLGRPFTNGLQAQLEYSAAQALKQAAQSLAAKNVRLVLWDGFRSEAMQKELLSLVHDERYVIQDSNHTKGLAVDVSLADSSHNYLDMGTDFDDFSEHAHVQAAGLSREQQANRSLLTSSLEAVGFSQWPYEWWHFNYGGGNEWRIH